MAGRIERTCLMCGSNVGFTRADDGFFYCGYCNSQADDIVDTGVDEEQIFSHFSASCNRVRPAYAIAAEPISQVKLTTSQFLDHPDILEDDMKETMGDGVGPIEPSDFGSSQKNFSYDDYYSEIRSRYLMGLQIMIHLQCQALVEKFNASPLIIGLVGPLWLRFLASTRIMADDWADQAVRDSEAQTQAYFCDMESYLQYCMDVVFAGSRPLYEDPGEEKVVELSRHFYQSNKDAGSGGTNNKRPIVVSDGIQKEVTKTRGDQSTCSTSTNSGTFHLDQGSDRPSSESPKDEAIRQLKLDMEENKFCYIPPRVKVKRKDYLHYARRRKDVYIYAVHADYYLLLRSCAKVAQVEVRVMHIAVLILERRLQWLEKRMDFSLHHEPNLNDFCDFCKDESQQNAANDPMDLST